MKKKSTWENFTISPTEGDLNPNEEREIIVTFQSKKEVEFNTQSGNHKSDIFLTILEGKS